MDFWTDAVDLYGRPGVAKACLALQGEYGADVNLLLFAVWLAGRGRALGPLLDPALAISAVAQAWIGPLRRTRRVLKPDADAAAVVTCLGAAELALERSEILALARLAGAPATVVDGRAGALENLAAYVRHANFSSELLGSGAVLRILDAAFGPSAGR